MSRLAKFVLLAFSAIMLATMVPQADAQGRDGGHRRHYRRHHYRHDRRHHR